MRSKVSLARPRILNRVFLGVHKGWKSNRGPFDDTTAVSERRDILLKLLTCVFGGAAKVDLRQRAITAASFPYPGARLLHLLHVSDSPVRVRLTVKHLLSILGVLGQRRR